MASNSAKIVLPSLCIVLLLLLLLHGEGRPLVSANSSNVDKRAAHKNKVLFAFGDSYADTGNIPKSFSVSWKEPYGTTFPGKPAGRFSDGRVLTDYIAENLGMRTPIAYRLRKYVPAERVKEGLNFAYGGSGVFDTLFAVPNMTVQIDLFEKLVKDSTYTSTDLNSSHAFVSLAGNDYSTYLVKNSSLEGLTSFIDSVVKQLSVNIRRIEALGVRKIAVTGLPPVGCLPTFTALADYKSCIDTLNEFVIYHDSLLRSNIDKYNNETDDHEHEHRPKFVLLDLYHTLRRIVQTKKLKHKKFKMAFKPCCMGMSSGDYCGDVDKNGRKRYTVCDDPNGAVFWDKVHPTQAGWRAVYSQLRSTLKKFH